MNTPDLNPPPPEKMSRRKKWSLAIVLLAILGGVVWLWSRDDVLEDDSDLVMEIAQTPELENGLRFFDDLVKTFDTYDSDFEEMVKMREPSADWDSVVARRAVDRFPQMLEAFQKAAEAMGIQSSGSTDLETDERFHTLEAASELSYAAARIELESQKVENALIYANSLLKAGRLVLRNNSNLKEYYIGRDLHSSGCEILQAAVTHNELEWNDGIEEMAGQMSGDPLELEFGFKRAHRCFYTQTKDRIQDETKQLFFYYRKFSSFQKIALSRRFLKPNRTLNQFAKHLRIAINDCDHPFEDIETELIFFSHPESKFPASGNSAGQALLSQEFVSGGIYPADATIYSRVGYRVIDLKISQTRIDMIRILAALRSYHHEKGSLPEELSQLTPDYIESIPMDRFDGNPLRYDKDKAKVWCVGEDLIDHGGHPTEKSKFSAMQDPMMQLKWLEIEP
jgi:hypothetical protein